jgi:methylmalonyl-CoA/ethylmalonyl-CoA epimerase
MQVQLLNDNLVGYKMDHLGYVVKNLNASIARFVKEGAEILIEPVDDNIQRVRICMLKIKGNIKIELVAPLDLDNSPVKTRIDLGGGLDHICFTTNNLNEALQLEKANGSVIVCQPVWAEAFKRHIAFVHRRSGLLVELLEDIF